MDFSAGAADSLSFNGTYYLRAAMGLNDAVDTESNAYFAGEVVATAAEIAATLGAAAPKAAARFALKKGAKEAGERLAHEAAEEAAQRAAREVAEKAAREGAERAAREAAEKGAKEGGERCGKEAGESATERARRLGREGEDAAGITGKKARVDVPGTRRWVVPDYIDDDLLREIKNVKSLSLTRQIRDYIAIAEESGRRFELIVREGTRLSRPLKEAIRREGIDLRYLPW